MPQRMNCETVPSLAAILDKPTQSKVEIDMRSMFVSIATVGCLFFASQAVLAKKGGAPYGMAGCGFGALLIDNHSKGPQIGSWFLNGLYGNQTYAISSGTSNCVESRTEMAAMEQSVYVTANFNSLQKEAAQGSGETLKGLADVLGCYADEDKARLGEMSQREFDRLFAEAQPEQLLQRYLGLINQDPMLSKSCTKAS